jgi:predicted transcriptional regulator
MELAAKTSKSNVTWNEKMTEPKRHFAICVDNADYEASLILRKIYEIIPDEAAATDDFLRIVDESGEDYLYHKNHFIVMENLLDIAAKIVQSQASVEPMSTRQIRLSLIETFCALQRMQRAEEQGIFPDISVARVEETQVAKKEPRESIRDDKIVCLECGSEMRQLTTKHLTSHNLTPREYKQKWGFSLKQPLSAKSLTKARSKAAKQRGLPANLVKFLVDRKLKKAKAALASDHAAEHKEGKPTAKIRPKARKTA